MPSLLYHCPCLLTSSAPPPPDRPSSSSTVHPLNSLYFCEECDAVRCNRCVSIEVSGYYCPNCLFEVPSASVRAEKNRCARNCFLCPHCRNTLSVVPSDPPELDVSAIGEPPFFLYCNSCRWDSADVGIVFDKPTGLAVQLQKHEDSAPDSLEFERLKEHFEPFIRASTLAASVNAPPMSSTHINPITAAASSALARDIPGVGKYSALSRHNRSKSERIVNKDELAPYRSRFEAGASGGLGHGGGEVDVNFMATLEDIGEVATIEQRWVGSWTSSLHASDLKPLRIPLHSKKSKRCPTCRHILIKPEQKAQSVRYKIKLVAANYLPAITVSIPVLTTPLPASTIKRSAAAKPQEDEKAAQSQLHAGKTYPFQLSLTNPLYDPITVKVTMQRTASVSGKRPPFAVSLPNTPFTIAAYAEAWEYEDDEEMYNEDTDDIDELLEMRGLSGVERGAREKSKNKTVGVLEKKANMTVVGGEVVVGKDGKGDVKFNMMVSYTYRSDDPAPSEGGSEPGGNVTKAIKNVSAPEMKTFSFYTVVDLGVIIPKDEIL
ncbi:dynactin p62 family-domain-containing protein [Hysterangium stoloniferum]|nr:dynactin p62 family-domain-containing protein [Hysterangium stoloniferum]